MLNCIPSTIEQRLNITYFYLDKVTKKFIGFISISAGKVTLKKKSNFIGEGENAKEGEYDRLPAVKIDQLAVSKTYQRKKIASLMIEQMLSKVYYLSKDVGIRLIIADILDNESNNGLFSKFEFKEFDLTWFSSKDKDRPSQNRTYSGTPYRVKPMYFDLKWVS